MSKDSKALQWMTLAALLLTSSLRAQVSEITPLVGWQAGGTVEVNQLGTIVKASPVFGLTISFDEGRDRRIDVLVLHQQTRAERHDPFEEPARAGVSVSYAQIGGRFLVHPGYVAGTIGLTRLGISGEHAINPSFALGVGFEFPVTKSIALRFDGRFHVTFANSTIELQCDSGGTCSGGGSGGSFSQFTATTGIVFRLPRFLGTSVPRYLGR